MRNDRFSLKISLAALAVIGLFLAGCRGAASETATPTPEAVDVEAEPVLASGEVVPARWMRLGFATGGLIEGFSAAEGASIQAGQELARLGDSALQAALAQANADLRHAEAVLDDLQLQPQPDALAAAQAALASAEVGLNRLERTGVRGAELEAAQAQVDSAKAALDQLNAGPNESQIRAASAEVQSAQQALDLIRQSLGQVILTAPYAGQVIEAYARAGDIVNAGTPILLLADLTSLQVETTDLSEIDVARIQVGDAATVTFDALPDISVAGTVKWIAPRAAEGANATFKVVIELKSLPAGLRWGMTAFVTIP